MSSTRTEFDREFDYIVVGAGTAGCVLAARLSEDARNRVCLIEAGPDYGARSSGAWPAGLLDPTTFCFTHDWGAGGEDDRSLESWRENHARYWRRVAAALGFEWTEQHEIVFERFETVWPELATA